MSTTLELLNEADLAVRTVLVEAERQERAYSQLPEPSVAGIWQESLDQLEGNLTRWQHLLGDVGEQVRIATDDLNQLEGELKQAVSAFSAARKFLQGISSD